MREVEHEKLGTDHCIAFTPCTALTQALNDPYPNNKDEKFAPRCRQHCRVSILPGTLRVYH